MTYTATYSPEDNKLRLSASSRLDAETYARVKAAGFKWAPKQDIFVAPMWTPEREDLLLELAGEIEDEDTSLVGRAEQRAERFEDYSDSRAADAGRARDYVASIADGIPLGQPILVGHHSERHARRDAERIENGMRRAVKMWETSKYWTDRAAGALRHAKYKELPAVRARRIKTLEAEQRKMERRKAEADKFLKVYGDPDAERATYRNPYNGEAKPLLHALLGTYEGGLSFEDQTAFERGTLNFNDAFAKAKANLERHSAHAARWIAHYSNRVAYERAMLGEQGGTIADQNKPEKGGAVRCWASPRGGWSYIQKVNKVSVTVLHHYENSGRNFPQNVTFDKLAAVMSAAAVQEARDTEQLIETAGAVGFILRNQCPAPTRDVCADPEPPEVAPLAQECEAMKESLAAGVKTVSAPQLFPTPPELARRMVEECAIDPGQEVLEPSAGTGNLCRAIVDAGAKVFAVEINHALAERLSQLFTPAEDRAQGVCRNVLQGDFLEMNGNLGTFDRIVMNPPFAEGAEIEHVRHAYGHLKPGGRLVSVMCSGPFFRGDRKSQAFREWIDEIGAEVEDLPTDTFKASGTGVTTKLVKIVRD